MNDIICIAILVAATYVAMFMCRKNIAIVDAAAPISRAARWWQWGVAPLLSACVVQGLAALLEYMSGIDRFAAAGGITGIGLAVMILGWRETARRITATTGIRAFLTPEERAELERVHLQG